MKHFWEFARAIWGCIKGIFFVLVILPLLFIGLSRCRELLFVDSKMRCELESQGRLTHVRDLLESQDGSEGTIIFDIPSIGYGMKRIWWIPEQLDEKFLRGKILVSGNLDPRKAAINEHEIEIFEKFTSVDSGIGILVEPYRFGRTEKRYRKLFENFDCISTFSGAVDFERNMQLAAETIRAKKKLEGDQDRDLV